MADTFDLNPTVELPPIGDGSMVSEAPATRVGALSVALMDNNLIGSVYQYLSESKTALDYNIDPSYKPSENRDLYEGVGVDYFDEITNARNREHGEYLNQTYREYTKNKEYLDELGLEGTFYQIGAYLGDIPLLTGFQKLATAGKLGTLFYDLNKSYTGRSLLMGTTEGSFEAVKQALSPTERTEMDMLVAVVGGGVIGGIYNPLKYDKETRRVLTETLTETVNTRAITDNVGDSFKFTDTVDDVQFNITSAYEKSKAPTMKALGQRLFNNVLKRNTGDFKAIEIRDQVTSAIRSSFGVNFNPLYLEFMETTYGKGALKSHFMIKNQDEFFNLAGDIFYGKANPIIKTLDPAFVKKVEDAFGNMSENSFDILQKAGHRKFVDGTISRTDEYMPLRWQRTAIKARTAAGEFTKAEFKGLIRKGLQSQLAKLGIKADATKIKKAADRFATTMYREDVALGKESYIVQQDAMRRAIDELQDIMGLTDAEAALIKGEADARKAAGKQGTASATKFRTPLDLEANVTLKNGTTLALKDFVDTNIQSSWTRYANSMGGDTALRALGFDSRKALLETRNQIEKELSNASGVLTPAAKRELAIFDNTVAHLLGKGTKIDPDGNAWRGVRIANNLVRSAKLGATWFAMATELSRLTHAHGIATMFQTRGAFRDVITAYRGKNFSNVYRELQLHEALGGELGQMASIAKYDDMLGELGGVATSRLEKVERFSDLAAEATALLGGVKSGTAVLEYWGSIAARSKMLKFAQKGMDKKAYDYFEKFGFNKETADKIAGQINKFSDKNPNYPLLNLDKWEGNLGHQWSLGTRRRSYELVQRANFGDQAAIIQNGQLIGDTVMGSLAMNLKSYMMVAYNKQLSKGLVDISRGGKEMMDTFGNWGYQSAFASMSYTAKTYSTYAGNKEKLDEMLTPARIAANTFSMTTFSTFIPSAVDFVASGITDEPLFNTYAKQGGSPFAVESYARDVVGAVKTLGQYVSPYANATESELRRALGVLPLSNVIGVRNINNGLASLLGESN